MSNTSQQELSEAILERAAQLLRRKGVGIPDATIILGSGLGKFTNAIQDPVVVPYSEIRGFPETGVAGHDGALYFGTVGERKILAWSGRFHHYEGHPFDRTVLPVRVAAALGCNVLVVTNAAGGINFRFRVGDLMLIDDIISLPVRVSPHTQKFHHRYASDSLVNEVTHLAAKAGIAVTRGTYLYAKGPTYETKAEIRAFRIMGADAVGMSTAAELNEAIRLQMTCLGISLITNLATGVSKKKLDHSEIAEAASLREKDLMELITRILSGPDTPLYKPEYRFR
ncbi:MAG: purine-nucleoside phosphorylase [Balneolaceae bacterium]|nr:MAG: purine-nucleoside phosphorylase [Balneolaceae bacterium]